MMLFVLISTFITGLLVTRLAIQVAHQYNLVDIPTARRRHIRPTPIIGGVAVFLTWGLGLLGYCIARPDWFSDHKKGLLVFSVSILLLMVAGLVDDLKGLEARGKLVFQFIAAVFTVQFHPEVHALLSHWTSLIGLAVWPLSVLWIVGVSNAVNLIDGLDGLAGGMSSLILASIALLHTYVGGMSVVSAPITLVLIAALSSFLFFNFNPAKVFLGDNGSLPTGFLIGATSLMCPVQGSSWVVLGSTLLMLGYPIIDMGLCSMRRYRKGIPLFKADRNHLHYKLQRLGLSVKQTWFVILSLGLYLQFAAFSFYRLPLGLGLSTVFSMLFSIFTCLFLLNAIVKHRVRRLSLVKDDDEKRLKATQRIQTLVEIELEPLFEVGLLEEKRPISAIIESLKLFLQTSPLHQNMLAVDRKIYLIFEGEKEISTIKNLVVEKLARFQSFYDLQFSLANLPVKIRQRTYHVFDTQQSNSLQSETEGSLKQNALSKKETSEEHSETAMEA
ncbi:MAG: glycosyltransferase family 4 protein [Bacteriovoracia bacterium]